VDAVPTSPTQRSRDKGAGEHLHRSRDSNTRPIAGEGGDAAEDRVTKFTENHLGEEMLTRQYQRIGIVFIFAACVPFSSGGSQ